MKVLKLTAMILCVVLFAAACTQQTELPETDFYATPQPTATEEASATPAPTEKPTFAAFQTMEPFDSMEFEEVENPQLPETAAFPAEEREDWLYADGNRIVDGDGKQVWITGVSWFGYNTGTNTFDGLWSANLRDTVNEIANRGFNLIRVPISAELVSTWAAGVYPQANINQSTNAELVNKNSLEIFDVFLEYCEATGIKVMMDIHSAETDASGHNAPLWYTDRVSEEAYLGALEWMAVRYAKNDTIIAYDLKNEPHGKAEETNRATWNDSGDAQNWRRAATTAALRVLKQNSNALVIVEGIEIYPKDTQSNGDFASANPDDYFYNWWGGNLRGVADFPLELGEYQNKLVYSPHDYGPAVYGQPWFHEYFTMETLYEECWRDNWFFIHEEKIAPLFIGEWGGVMEGTNLQWMEALQQFIIKNKLNHAFWCLNANSGDTGGLLLDDFMTWDEAKYAFVKKVLWQQDDRFVGLDAQMQLGENGVPRP